MRIAISGCAGVGKSTTSKLLSEYLTKTTGSEYLDITGIGKEIMTQIYGSPNVYKKLSASQMLQLNRKIIEQKIAIEKQSKFFVADRSTLDYLAILLAHCLEVIAWDEFESLLQKCAKHDATYDLIVMLQHNSIPVKDDNIRFTNDSYQYMIEMIERGFYKKSQINYVELYETAAESRMKKIVELLSDLRH